MSCESRKIGSIVLAILEVQVESHIAPFQGHPLEVRIELPGLEAPRGRHPRPEQLDRLAARGGLVVFVELL